MPINDRSAVEALIHEAFSDTFLTEAPKASTALSAFPVLNLGSAVTQLAMVDGNSAAQFIGETSESTPDEGLKPASAMSWGKKTLYVSEVAQVQTVPDAVLEDATGDVVRSIVTDGTNAIAKALDNAVIPGIGKPANWSSDALIPAAVSEGNVINLADGDAVDLLDALHQASEQLLDAGYEDLVLLTRPSTRSVLANERGTDGHRVNGADVLDGFTSYFTNTLGADYTALVVAREDVRLGIRSDVKVDTSNEATVDGVSMFQNDLTAFRFFARYGFVTKSNKGVVAIRKTSEAA